MVFKYTLQMVIFFTKSHFTWILFTHIANHSHGIYMTTCFPKSNYLLSWDHGVLSNRRQWEINIIKARVAISSHHRVEQIPDTLCTSFPEQDSQHRSVYQCISEQHYTETAGKDRQFPWNVSYLVTIQRHNRRRPASIWKVTVFLKTRLSAWCYWYHLAIPLFILFCYLEGKAKKYPKLRAVTVYQCPR